MSEFKNMKIEITNEAHLKDVCDVLDSMGYTRARLTGLLKKSFIVTDETDGKYYIFCNDNFVEHFESLTLQDLLKIRDDMVKK